VKPLARLAVAIARVLYRLLFRWSVTGGEHVPEQGPCLLIANHVHLADPVLLMLAFPRPITFMAKEELFRIPIWGHIMRDGGMFPVARTGTLQQKRDVMRLAEDLLTQGRVLALFPEGKRSPSGVLIEGKPGAAVLSARTGAPLVPVAIEGTEKIRGKWWWVKRPRVTVTIGVPFHLTSTGGRLVRSESARLTGELMRQLARLLPPERRGVYAD
jgi:1-acyl-sn-glycerol-3-phosphate acyltransferase